MTTAITASQLAERPGASPIRTVAEAAGWIMVAVASAAVSVPAGIVVMAAVIAWQLSRKQPVAVLTLLLLLLIVADSRQDVMQPAKTLRMVVVILLAAYSLSMAAQLRLSPIIKWFVPFTAVALVAATRGGQTMLAVSKAVSYFLVIVIAFQLGARLARDRTWQMARTVERLIAAVMWTGLALVLVMPSVALLVAQGVRFRGMMGNPDGIGVLATIVLPFQLALLDVEALERRRSIKWAIAATVVSCIVSGSRGGLIGMLICVLTRWLIRGNWRVKATATALGVLLAVGSVKLVNSADEIAQTSAGEALRAQTLASGGGRLFAWAYALDYINSAPVIGRGFAFDELIFNEDYREVIFTERGGHQGGIHNGYLGLALDTGYLGLALYALFVIVVVRRLRRWRVLAPLVIAVIWSCIVEGWIVASLNAYTLLFYIEMLIMACLPLVALTGRGARDVPQPTS